MDTRRRGRRRHPHGGEQQRHRLGAAVGVNHHQWHRRHRLRPPSGTIVILNGFNVVSDGTCLLRPQDSDQPAANAWLLPLDVYAPGTMPTHALNIVSPALDRIPHGGLGCGTAISANQRGVARPRPAAAATWARSSGSREQEFWGYLPLAASQSPSRSVKQ